jgi:hypothetical protein
MAGIIRSFCEKNINIKGSTTLIFANQKQSNVVVANTNVNANSMITAIVSVTNDEIFAQNFQLQIVKNNSVGFTIYCNPKIGWHKGNVNINYQIQ